MHPRSLVRRLLGIEPEFAPTGHFYSPIPDRVALAASDHWDRLPTSLPGIDLAIEEQLALLQRIGLLPRPDWERADPARRYVYDNPFFSYADAIALHGMLALEAPTRIVEVGSGYSTAVILDTLEQLQLQADVQLTCIEPYPDRLRALLRPTDRPEIIVAPVQAVPLSAFDALEAGDILFIDSSHIAKCGSDVNHLFFEVLSRLSPGVRVHIHDVFYPFEYPRDWVIVDRRSFNEDYLLRAFLMFNGTYRIELWSDCLAKVRREALIAAWPLAMRNTGGSIWLRRISADSR